MVNIARRFTDWIGKVRHLGLLLALACVGCGLIEPRSLPPECRDEALVAVETMYVRDVLTACNGLEFDECEARIPIEEHYAIKREEWITCRQR